MKFGGQVEIENSAQALSHELRIRRLQQVREQERYISASNCQVYKETIDSLKARKTTALREIKQNERRAKVFDLTTQWGQTIVDVGTSHRAVKELNKKSDLMRLLELQKSNRKKLIESQRTHDAASFVTQKKATKEALRQQFNNRMEVRRNELLLDRETAHAATESIAASRRAREQLAALTKTHRLKTKIKDTEYVTQSAIEVPERGRSHVHVRITKHARLDQDSYALRAMEQYHEEVEAYENAPEPVKKVLRRPPPLRLPSKKTLVQVKKKIETIHVENDADAEEIATNKRLFTHVMRELLARKKVKQREEVAIVHVKTIKEVNHMDSQLLALYNADRSGFRLARPRAADAVAEDKEHPDILAQFEQQFLLRPAYQQQINEFDDSVHLPTTQQSPIADTHVDSYSTSMRPPVFFKREESNGSAAYISSRWQDDEESYNDTFSNLQGLPPPPIWTSPILTDVVHPPSTLLAVPVERATSSTQPSIIQNSSRPSIQLSQNITNVQSSAQVSNRSEKSKTSSGSVLAPVDEKPASAKISSVEVDLALKQPKQNDHNPYHTIGKAALPLNDLKHSDEMETDVVEADHYPGAAEDDSMCVDRHLYKQFIPRKSETFEAASLPIPNQSNSQQYGEYGETDSQSNIEDIRSLAIDQNDEMDEMDEMEAGMNHTDTLEEHESEDSNGYLFRREGTTDNRPVEETVNEIVSDIDRYLGVRPFDSKDDPLNKQAPGMKHGISTDDPLSFSNVTRKPEQFVASSARLAPVVAAHFGSEHSSPDASSSRKTTIRSSPSSSASSIHNAGSSSTPQSSRSSSLPSSGITSSTVSTSSTPSPVGIAEGRGPWRSSVREIEKEIEDVLAESQATRQRVHEMLVQPRLNAFPMPVQSISSTARSTITISNDTTEDRAPGDDWLRESVDDSSLLEELEHLSQSWARKKGWTSSSSRSEPLTTTVKPHANITTSSRMYVHDNTTATEEDDDEDSLDFLDTTTKVTVPHLANTSGPTRNAWVMNVMDDESTKSASDTVTVDDTPSVHVSDLHPSELLSSLSMNDRRRNDQLSSWDNRSRISAYSSTSSAYLSSNRRFSDVPTSSSMSATSNNNFQEATESLPEDENELGSSSALQGIGPDDKYGFFKHTSTIESDSIDSEWNREEPHPLPSISTSISGTLPSTSSAGATFMNNSVAIGMHSDSLRADGDSTSSAEIGADIDLSEQSLDSIGYIYSEQKSKRFGIVDSHLQLPTAQLRTFGVPATTEGIPELRVSLDFSEDRSGAQNSDPQHSDASVSDLELDEDDWDSILSSKPHT